MGTSPRCRHCHSTDLLPVIDLGTSPPSNAYPPIGTDPRDEPRLPLRVGVCPGCWLMQTEDVVGREQLFTADYAYHSSYSTTWVEHARIFVERTVDELALGPRDLVVEVASNDGYLLQHVLARSVRALGIEPTAGTAAVARGRGIETIERFFGAELALELAGAGQRPRLMVANNVLAHVPDIDDFLEGFAILLADDGLATFEFPHLLVLLRDGLYDTIYHEHYSYLSLGAVQRIMAAHGLDVVRVETLASHGGSLRIHAMHRRPGAVIDRSVADVLQAEREAGLFSPQGYSRLQALADRTASWLTGTLTDLADRGQHVMAYGAAAKGTTLLNHAGVGVDLLPRVADRSPFKQGRQMPGTGIPIVPPEAVEAHRPDVLLVLAWNLADEVERQLAHVRTWGGRFAAPLPTGRLW